MVIKKESQAIIVGAGPAGAAASVFLSKAGIPHVIIEKETFPRNKVCGDACGGKTAFVLRKANPQWLQEIFGNADQFMPTPGALFVSSDGKTLSIPFGRKNIPPGQAAGFTTPRLVFDNFLFERLASPQATIYQKAALNNIERLAGDKVKASFLCQDQHYEITAPLLIGADGDKSQVRKLFFSDHFLSRSHCVAIRTYYTGVTELHKENFIELHYLPEILPGYFWIFPLPNGIVNVGVGMLSAWVRKKRINLREEMLKAIQNSPIIRHRFAGATQVGKIQGWGLPMSMKKQRISGDNFLLAGDAASLVDPFTGEGIGNALYSGMLAAHAVKEALLADKYHSAFLQKNYDDKLFKSIGEELKTSAFLQRLCYYPWLFSFIVNKAYKSPSLHKAISGMFTGVDLRAELRKPSFYAKVLLNQ